MKIDAASPAENLFRQAVESSVDVVLILDLNGRIRFLNRAAVGMFAMSDASEGRGRNWTTVAPAHAREAIRDAVAEAARGGVANFETRISPRTGPETCWDVNVSPMRDDEGAICGGLAVMRDITAIKVASRDATARLPQATATAAVLRSALRLAQLDAWRYDCIRGRVAFTPELRDNLGQSPDDQPLSEALKIWIEEDRARFKQQLLDAARKGAGVFFEGRIAMPDGETRWLRVQGEPELLDGRCVALRGASQDITEELAVVARLRASEETAQHAAETMSSFLAAMGHEIRTPLNGVLGMAQVMAMGELPDAQREHLRVIQASGASLLALLNDLLDLSKIEAGRIELEDGLIDPQALADSARAFEPLVRDKGVRLSVKVTPGVRGLWKGDITRVRQILNNLVSNAVKFTEEGAVEVELADVAGDFVMRVRDTGIGIAPDKIGGIFNKFTQADTSTTRRFGGTGLGLAICQELAVLMGGDIRVDSVVGEGTTFTARLPLVHVEAAAPVAEGEAVSLPAVSGAALASGLRVLAAEDNATNQLVLKTLLMAVGIEPTIVSNGREALDAWSRGDWDVVLMDIQMPVLDGLEAVIEMRATEQREGRGRTPVVALTANAMTHQRDEYLAAGMDALVAKPIELTALIEAMDSVLAIEADSAPAARVEA